MIGENEAKISLPKEYSCLHPVVNVSLLTPFVESDYGATQNAHSVHSNFKDSFTRWALARFSPDYCCLSEGFHKYLVWDHDVSALNDEWKELFTLSPSLDSFLQQFHEDSPSRGPGPPQAVWILRSGLLV